jgi:acyl carrier protein
MNLDLKERVFSKVSQLIKKPVGSISPDMVIADIVPDSITYFTLFLELEREIGKKLTFETVISIRTLGDVIAFIEKEKNATY